MAGLTLSRFALLEEETTDLVEALRRSVVQVRTRHGQGSGVIWNPRGLLITNHHVATGERALVELTDGRRLDARVIARDRTNDLAALIVSAEALPAVTVGDSRSLRVGEIVIAVGNPFGVQGTATFGIVSATGNRTWMGEATRDLLQADVDLAPGNSGGPLADSEGRVVGIASMIVSPGIAVAIPTHVVHRFVANSHWSEWR